MLGTNGLADHKFPSIASGPLSAAQLAAALSSGTPSTVSLAWNLPAVQADARVFRLTEVGEFFQGAKATNESGAFWPAERYYKPTYVPSNATLANGLVVTPGPSSILNKSYAEFGLTYSDRNSGRIYTYISFQ